MSWKDGDFEELLREGRTIQQHISKVHVTSLQG